MTRCIGDPVRRGRWVFVLVLALTSPSFAVDDTPTAFLTRLYEGYQRGDAPSPTGKIAGSIFAHPLLDLLRRDQSLARGEVGALDHDPLCSCQDYDKLTDVAIRLNSNDGSQALATVSFLNGTERFTTVFQLIHVGSVWRIEDIQERDTPDLKRFLETSIGGGQTRSKNSYPGR